MIATTAYLDLFLRKITDPHLLFVFLKLICVERFDDQLILLTLVSRCSGSSKVPYSLYHPSSDSDLWLPSLSLSFLS